MAFDIGVKEIMSLPVKGVGGVSSSTAGKKEGAEEARVTEERTEPKVEYSVADLERVASDIKIHLKTLNTELRFEINGDDRDVIIKITDAETDEVVRQIPSEELVAIRERIDELVGFLFDAKT